MENKLNKTTSDPKEIKNFEKITDDWWNFNGEMKMLHAFTPIRIKYIIRALSLRKLIKINKSSKSESLKNIRILDVGCGGGILCEPMVRLGGIVFGIDASKTSIQVAKKHAKSSNLKIKYLCENIETFAKNKNNQGQFDLICVSEVIEHVINRDLFIHSISKLLSNKGIVVVTTIDKSFLSLIFVKFLAENIFNIIPKGTHDFNKFVSPKTLQKEFFKHGILIDNITGLTPLPNGKFKMSSITSLNYAASGGFI